MFDIEPDLNAAKLCRPELCEAINCNVPIRKLDRHTTDH